MNRLGKYLFLHLFLLLSMQEISAQFKFGLGVLGYARIANPDFRDQFVANGWNSYLEFGGLIKDHYEPGVRINTNLLFSADLADNFTAGFLYNVSVMPYLRYYFLEMRNFRPYVIGGLGYNYNATVGFKVSNPNDLQNTNVESLVYSGSSFGARVGGGIRLVRFLDLSVIYYYAGWVKPTESLNNNNFAGSGLKDRYNIHVFEFQLAFAFGGNLEKDAPKKKKY
jgi:hypothetical protein